MNRELVFCPLGDNGILIRLDEDISYDTNRLVQSMSCEIESESICGLQEIIPSYNSILILYDPLVITYDSIISHVNILWNKMNKILLPNGGLIHIPVLYGLDMGTDLQYVADYNHLTIQQVITIHSSTDYLIYMLGFTPGFPYLGGMSKKISTPRLEKPRVNILEGSVGIAGDQTGIYPLKSPGGWRIIGRTPLRLFDPTRNPPFLLKAGQYIRFVPVDKEEYEKISLEVEKGTYILNLFQTYEGEKSNEQY